VGGGDEGTNTPTVKVEDDVEETGPIGGGVNYNNLGR